LEFLKLINPLSQIAFAIAGAGFQHFQSHLLEWDDNATLALLEWNTKLCAHQSIIIYTVFLLKYPHLLISPILVDNG
jgi:hypothetical protein